MKSGVAGPLVGFHSLLCDLSGAPGCAMSLPVGLLLLEWVESNLSLGHQCGVGAYSNSCSLFFVFYFPFPV